MAENDSISNEQVKKTLMIDDERGFIALSASGEIEGLSDLLQNQLKAAGDIEIVMFRGIAKRIKDLNSIIMSSISDSVESTDELQARLD